MCLSDDELSLLEWLNSQARQTEMGSGPPHQRSIAGAAPICVSNRAAEPIQPTLLRRFASEGTSDLPPAGC